MRGVNVGRYWERCHVNEGGGEARCEGVGKCERV